MYFTIIANKFKLKFVCNYKNKRVIPFKLKIILIRKRLEHIFLVMLRTFLFY